MKLNKYIVTLAVLALAGLGASHASALSTTPEQYAKDSQNGRGMMGNNGMMGNRPMMGPTVFGKVTAVSGNKVTVLGKQGFSNDEASTTFTVDATNAKVMKDKVAGTVSSILVGDTVMVQGTVTGSNVVATSIRDGVFTRGYPGNMKMNGDGAKGHNGDGPGGAFATSTGNGQPVVAGSVTSINGSTIVITNKSNVTYTIDASSAKITLGPKAATISDVKVGDEVVVQGTINGNAVVASSVMDQTRPADSNNSNGKPAPHGFFGGVGAWFAHLFGF